MQTNPPKNKMKSAPRVINGKHTPTYNSYLAMHQRCSNPNNIGWHRYGGRGIKVCKRWKSYDNFYEDMGERPENTTLDRMDNDKDYQPDNCVWATPRVQGRNKSSNHIVTLNGVEMCITDAASMLNVSTTCILYRLDHDLPLDMISVKGQPEEMRNISVRHPHGTFRVSVTVDGKVKQKTFKKLSDAQAFRDNLKAKRE